MNCKIVYKSKGNTKKIAEAMAGAIGADAIEMKQFNKAEDIDVLFLGFGIYGGNVLPEVETFIGQLTSDKIKRIVLFTSSGYGKDQTAGIREKLKAQGLTVEEKAFACKGKAFLFMNRNYPGEADFLEAANFAKEFVKA